MDRNILFSRSESGFVNTLDDLGKSGQNRGKEGRTGEKRRNDTEEESRSK
jgi:hypothetical protein